MLGPSRPSAHVRRGALLTVLLGICSFAPAVGAQTEVPPRARSMVVATALAVNAPGAGHYYAGERGKAVTIASVATGGLLLFLSGWGSDDCYRTQCDPGPARLRERVGARIVVGAYLFSLVDAPLAVRRQNRSRAGVSQITANIIVSAHGAPGLAMRIPLQSSDAWSASAGR